VLTEQLGIDLMTDLPNIQIFQSRKVGRVNMRFFVICTNHDNLRFFKMISFWITVFLKTAFLTISNSKASRYQFNYGPKKYTKKRPNHKK